MRSAMFFGTMILPTSGSDSCFFFFFIINSQKPTHEEQQSNTEAREGSSVADPESGEGKGGKELGEGSIANDP